MNVPEFCCHVFPPFLHNILSKFCYADLVSTIESIDPSIRFLILSCADVFFHSKGRMVTTKELWKTIPGCLETAQFLLDLTWEKLNTGCWKNADRSFRCIYSYISLFKALCLILNSSSEVKDIVCVCDMGILIGAPILDNSLSKIASKLMSQLSDTHSLCSDEESHLDKKMKLNYSSEVKIDLAHPVRIFNWISIDEFCDSFLKRQEPVLILKAIHHWKALNKWNIDYILKKCRYRTVPVEIGSKYTDKNWTQKLMTVEQFVHDYIWKENNTSEVGYLAQYNLFDQIPELKEDIHVPNLIKSLLIKEKGDYTDDYVDINAWFGPENTISSLHYDRKHNFLAQVMGEKYVRLYSKKQTDLLYPREGTIFSNTSHVDVEHPDLDTYPLFGKAPYTECLLKAGNILYIPPECWHYVKSLSVSFSVSFWW